MAAATLSSQAGTFTSDFNTGALPSGSHTNPANSGGAYLELTGGVGDSGCLKITKNQNDQRGSFILDDLDAGSPIYGFDATFKLRIGGGGDTPADGIAFCVGSTITDTSIWGEEGAGDGLRFAWRVYRFSGQTPPDPAIRIQGGSGGTTLAWKGYDVPGITTSGDVTTWWTDVHIRLNPDGSLTMDYKGANIVTNFFVPGYQDFANLGVPMRFGFGGRTGGANANMWVDDLQITTFTTPLVGISQQPFSQTVQQGNEAAFEVRVANNNGVTYQWLSNNVPIADATSQTLIITNVQPAFSGSQYKVIATGPNNSATSSVVTLTVTNLALPPAQLSFNFNDGLTPPEVTLAGNPAAIVDTTGGVANSGVVKLVAPAGSGTLIVTNPAEAGLPVFGFTARFKLLVGGGTVPPADGFAFAFGNDIPDAPSGDFESGLGLGNGLRVTFDIYDNSGIFGFPGGEGAQPAPSIDVRLGGQVLGTVKLPISFMETGLNDDLSPRYQDTIVQLNTDGTLNVVYHGALVFDHLPIPSFTSVTGGRFAIAARTGGLNANIWVDNFELTSVTTPGAIRITTQPVSQTILVNHAMTSTVEVNDTAGVTYQWFRGGVAIGGATSSSYVLSPVTVPDSGATFNVQVTKASVTVTSSVVTLTVADLTAPVSPNLTFNFNDGLVPTGTTTYGTPVEAPGGYITANGGVGDSGVLHITDAVNGQQGAFVISNLYNGAQVSAIAVSFDVLMGGGTTPPADGFSFNFAANLAAGVAGGNEGNGNGLSITFDTYDNGNENPPAPSIDVKYKGAVIASTQIPFQQIDTAGSFRTVLLRVDQDGKLFLSYGERVLYNGLQLPNYTFTAAGRFGFYGNTGGLNANQWVDNILIKGTQSSGPLTVITHPANTTVIAGSTTSFSVVLSDPNGATYQWQRQSLGGSFTNIPGATTSSYTTPATTLADSGALFRVNATGPSGSTASSNALLTVVAPITVSNPIMTYNFNDCALPPDTFINGSAAIACVGGIADSGGLHLTDNANSQQGSFLMPGFNANAPVSAITVAMRIRIADGTGTPADGISFVWGTSNSIPDTANFGEGGVGDGLVVGLITYAGRADGPSFYVTYRGNNLFQRLVPYSTLFTGDLSADPLQQYATLAIRVNGNGTLDLQYKGNAILNALPLTGYTPFIGARFGLGARTGGENETHWIDDIAIATTVGVNQPALEFSSSGNTLNLTWGAGFKLQSTGSLTPPVTWTDVAGATSPHPASTATGTNQFFRLINVP